MSNHTSIARSARRRPLPATALAAAALAVAGAGCSSDPPILTVEIITGQETDAFSQEPAVTRVDITGEAAEGDLSLSASAPPGGTFDFGEVPEDRLLSFELTGVDATGATVVRGRSLGGILLSAVSGGVIPVFAQRVNQWARPPGGLLAAHLGAPAVPLAERYLVSTGGTSAFAAGGAAETAVSEFYDLFSYSGTTGPTLPRAALSSVARASALLLIDNAGATWIDFGSGAFDDMDLPKGLDSFADVAGGQTIDAPDGRSFVVAATRRDVASKAVLVINVDGSLEAVSLPEARMGAAAAWVDGIGLAIAGGSATEPGVVVLTSGGKVFTAKPFPPDATEGAGAVVVDPERLTLLGGLESGVPAPTRVLDLRCTAACVPEVEAGASLPVAVTGVVAYALASGRAIAVGDEASADGLTRSFIVDLTGPSAIEIPLREPRKGATTTPAPNGTLGLVGGLHPDGTPALSVEMFFPL